MINVLVIGSGAYVSGINSKGFGTILPSLVEGTRQKIIDKITIVSKHSSSYKEFQKKVKTVQRISNVKLKYDWYLKNGSNEMASALSNGKVCFRAKKTCDCSKTFNFNY